MRVRQPTRPSRVKLTPIQGEENHYTQEMADLPYDGYEGTPFDPEHVLSDTTAAALGIPVRTAESPKGEYDPTPNDAYKILAPAIHIANRIYEGVDLTGLYQSEVYETEFPTIFDWIKARIEAEDFSFLNVGDYIPVMTKDGILLKEQIAGINTYKNYGDAPTPEIDSTPVRTHIDFISKDCHPKTMYMNRVNYNNGTTVDGSPYLASELEAILNSKQKSVPNATTATPAMVAADYRTSGILNTLPDELIKVISPKRVIIPRRFTAGSLLTDDNSWDWKDLSPLWIPFEMEVYGCGMFGSPSGYAKGGFQQYPIFSCNMARVKGAGDGGGRSHWWLGSAAGGNSTNFAAVSNNGYASSTNASNATLRVPVCFRIQKSK